MTCEACRTLPPVVGEGYLPKGSYEIIAGLNTYVTGKKSSSIGIVDIYDIFGFSIQTFQGADILATRLNALVLMPDFFHGESVQAEWFPLDTTEKKENFTRFMAEHADIHKNVEVLMNASKEYRTKFPSAKIWGALGLCWGGKIASLASGVGTPFVASGQVHPGRADKAHAEKLTIPHIVLASKDEPAEAIAGYAEVIGSNATGGHVETYSTIWHGWMGARTNLQKEDCCAEYARGYTQLAQFFEKHLQ